MNPTLSIEVAFATPQQQKIIPLVVRANCSLKEAIQLSGLATDFPEYDLVNLPLGIFGKRIYDPENYQLKAGDRIEIYRPLAKSPNQIRLERAKNQ